jgi:two-component system CheB/CheR fusion protein
LLVAADHNIVYYSQGVNRYLDTPAGEPTHQVIQRIRRELAAEVTAGLFRAIEHGEPSFSAPITLKLEGNPRQVLVGVWPTDMVEANRSEPRLALVLFHERELQDAMEPMQSQQAEDTIVGLEGEVATLQRRLQTILEEYETSKEEMQAANEELQSMNEELRATAEELETSKEEMQSVNEELITVNQENKHRVEEMTQLASDLQNLLSATDIATLFLDRQLQITRFTPRAGELFNVLPTDRGRPLAHLTHKLGYAHLLDDAAQVLRTLIPAQREIRSNSGQWYLTRLMPYRSIDDRIEGVVITLVEITEQKESELALRHVQELYQQVSDSSLIAIAFVNTAGVIREANDTFVELVGYTQADIQAGRVRWDQLTPPEWAEQTRQVQEQLRVAGRAAPHPREFLCKDGSRVWGLSAAATVAGRDEQVVFVVERGGRAP